jgi:hypothetical protein
MNFKHMIGKASSAVASRLCALCICTALTLLSANDSFADETFGDRIGSFTVTTGGAAAQSVTGEAFITVEGAGCTRLVIVTEIHTQESFAMIRERPPVFQVDPGPYLGDLGVDPDACGFETRMIMVARSEGSETPFGQHVLGRWSNAARYEAVVQMARAQIAEMPTDDPDLVWNHLDLDAVAWDDRDSWDAREFVRLNEVPNIDRVPVHPEYGSLIMLYDQHDRRNAARADRVMALYARVEGDACIILQTLYPPRVAGDRHARFRGEDRFFPTHNPGTLFEGLGLDRAACPEVTDLWRVATLQGGFDTFFVDGQRVDEATFAAHLAGTVEAPLELPPLPGGLSNAGDWQYYYRGGYAEARDRDLTDYLIAAYAYSTIAIAHSNRVNDIDGRCAYPEDASRTIDTANFGTLGSREVIMNAPPAHDRVMNQMLGETRLEAMFLRSYLSDAERIVRDDGCAGPRVWILRENLRRFIEFQEPLSRSELEAALSRL